MRHRPPTALIKFLKPYSPEVQALALQLRALVLDEMAPCYENIYDAYSAVAIGYGTSDRLKDGIFHIAEFVLLVGVKLKDVPPGVGALQEVLAKYELTAQG